MNRALSSLIDLLRVNKAYLTNQDWRHRVRTSVLRDPAPDISGVDAAEHAVSIEPRPMRPSSPYDELTSVSTALLRGTAGVGRRHLNVVLPEVHPGAIFAGVKTALEAASGLAAQLELPLRVVCILPSPDPADDEQLRSELEIDLRANHIPEGIELRAVSARQLDTFAFGADDIWLATHWTTAHAIDVACRAERIERANVVYLIQDYEPGFTPWSTDFALARSTYAAGFLHVVNSTHLAAYLSSAEPQAPAPVHVFGPAFDIAQLERSFLARTPGAAPRVFFYARPSKPRNLYGMGVTAIRLAAAQLAEEGIAAEFVMAGEAGDDVVLSDGSTMSNLGVLQRDEYFALLSTIDVGLSLQYSPHPSHPPFDLALAGAICITNDFGGLRDGVHPDIHSARADPDALARAVVEAVRDVVSGSRAGGRQREFSGLRADMLGRPLSDVIGEIAPRLGG